MENKQVPVSGIVFLFSLWAFYYCLHNIIDIMVSSSYGQPELAILWAIISGTLFIAGLIIHFYYQTYSEAPAKPLLNTREIMVILIAIIAVVIFSFGSSIAGNVAENEDVANIIATIRDLIEIGSLVGIYAVFNPDRFVKKTDGVNAVEAKKQQLKELFDSGILTKEEYEKEINSL